MIDRSIIMAMLQALPDDKILQALQVVSAAPDASGELSSLSADPTGQSADNKIQPWNAKEITYGGGKDRPALIDRMWAKPETNAMQPVPAQTMAADDGQSQYMQTGGM